nr:MAG TPA: hypothetical protein [Caudoviricetes sp.]
MIFAGARADEFYAFFRSITSCCKQNNTKLVKRQEEKHIKCAKKPLTWLIRYAILSTVNVHLRHII